MSNKILSVIVPSYNMEAYLPKCLGSLVIDDRELLEKLEVIVVNDGSKDRTSEIAHEFEAKYPGVFRVIDKPNGHYGSCINAALPLVTGTYVKVLDADDWFDTEGLVKFIEFLISITSPVDLILSDFDTVNATGKTLWHHSYNFPKGLEFGFCGFASNTNYLPMHAYTYRASIIIQSGYRQLEGVSYTDAEWVLVPLTHVAKIMYCPLVVYKYLLGRDGQSMEGAQYKRNFWMVVVVTMDIIRKTYNQLNGMQNYGRTYINTKLIESIAHVYRCVIFDSNMEQFKSYLISFDIALQEEFPALYQCTDSLCYGDKLPFRFIHEWRKHKKINWFWRISCKSYSYVAHSMAKIRPL